MQGVPGIGTASREMFTDQTTEMDGSRLWVTNTTWQGNYYGGSGVYVGPFGVYMEGVCSPLMQFLWVHRI